MHTALAFIVALGAGLLTWRGAMRARETAMAAARAACRRRDAQLLDDTVALVRLGLTRAPSGRVCLRRVYGFECSYDGVARVGGVEVFSGAALETVHVPEPELGARGA